MFKVLGSVISFLKIFVLPEKTGRKVMNQSMSLKNSLVRFILLEVLALSLKRASILVMKTLAMKVDKFA